jgi:hypothetical protein
VGQRVLQDLKDLLVQQVLLVGQRVLQELHRQLLVQQE